MISPDRRGEVKVISRPGTSNESYQRPHPLHVPLIWLGGIIGFKSSRRSHWRPPPPPSSAASVVGGGARDPPAYRRAHRGPRRGSVTSHLRGRRRTLFSDPFSGGEGLRCFLGHLASGAGPVPGPNRPALLGVDRDGTAHLPNPLFLSVPVGPCSTDRILPAFVGERPSEGLPPDEGR